MPLEPVGEQSNERLGIEHHAPEPAVGGTLWLSGVDCSMEFVDGRPAAKHTEAKSHQLVAVPLTPIGVRQKYEPRS
jgi:hypothetical protein